MSFKVIILEHNGETFPERWRYGVNIPWGAGDVKRFSLDQNIQAFVRERQQYLAPYGHPRANSVVRVTLK